MSHFHKRFVLVPALAFALILPGCKSGVNPPATPVASQATALTRVANALHDVTISVGALQSATIAANKAGLVSDSTAVTIVGICVKVQQGEQQANQLTRAYSTFPPGSKPKLSQIINPLLTAVSNTTTAEIKDPATRAKVDGYLAAISTGLSIVIQIVEGN